MSNLERICMNSPEAREALAAYRNASDDERRRVIHNEPCEHVDTEDGKCLECGEWVGFTY